LRVQIYKVAVWATGGVGRFAIRTIVDRPNLELVGAWVHSARKDGEDVGTLAGIAPVGVRASRDEGAVLDGDADCVVYAAPAGSGRKKRWPTSAASWLPARTSSPHRFPAWFTNAGRCRNAISTRFAKRRMPVRVRSSPPE
jgi:hypothetical protein